jgi:formaldehyde-activating enzyme involved in methanogenesis
MSDPGAVHIGESFIGEAAEAAHINVVLGHRAGPVGTAWATAVATPSADDLVLIAAVWVNPAPADADLGYANNRAATRAAPFNPYYQAT